ncbi:exonuclease domain-containing protein [Nocardia sp. NPDC052001]|uniref:TerD family protein n=1 Tax=Nocardia sp. NPDC052001 TaxID=3154853 RepID=UPI003426EB40
MHANAEFGSFTLVDVETSGLSASEDRVLSVAVLTLADDGRVQHEFHTLVNPGCDPGPVEIHGLTREKLHGAPTFEAIRPRLAELLTGRVLVAHNASFDYGFLHEEFTRAGAILPVERQLCTLAFARRLAPPTANFKLGTLAAHYGVRQTRAHDALDDTRVLAGVLHGLMSDARRFGVSPPLMPPQRDQRRSSQRWPKTRTGPKALCPFAYPGRFQEHGRLVQGMKIAITGETHMERSALAARAEAAGLDVTTSLSRRTSVLVTNESRSQSRKVRDAVEFGTALLTEAAFLALLTDIAPGTAKGATGTASATSTATGTSGTAKGAIGTAERGTGTARGASGAAKGASATVEGRSGSVEGASTGSAKSAARQRSSGPLSGRRFLVLGGTHDQRAAATADLTARGASVAVNLSASVTDVLALSDAASDRRYSRAAGVGLPIHGPESLTAGEFTAAHQEPAVHPNQPRPDAAPGLPAPSTPIASEPLSLARGQVMDLPIDECGGDWTLRASWKQNGGWEVDVVAFLLTDDEMVTGDPDFVFYNQRSAQGVELAVEGPSEQSLSISLDHLPEHCRRIAIAAAIDGPGITFGDVGAIEIEAAPGGDQAVIARATLDAATEERTLLLAEVYQRGETWRLRALGQGYATDLAALATRYGISVA